MMASSLIVLLCLLATSSAQGQQLTQSMVTSLLDALRQDKTEPRDEQLVLKEYDFVVVGAGTAGCTITNRLTEVDDWKVLLIEAGEEENFLMDVPALTSMWQQTSADWGYKTEPSVTACLGLHNKQCRWPRGKVMGGTSVLNNMVYSRGNRRDYDHWAALGNTGWSYDKIQRFFMKSEDMTIPELAKDIAYHSHGGPLTVSYPPYRTPLADAFLAAGDETGQRRVDYNAGRQTGFSYVQATMKNGSRWSASRAFLRPISERNNLHVKKQSLVTRILFDQTKARATGVEFVSGKRKFFVKAKREVIVSAGAINSPQLLMVSGIGPKEHLDEMKIPVVRDLRVGYNLQDHISFAGLTFLVDQNVSLLTDDIVSEQNNILDYFVHHKGQLTVPGIEALAYYDLQNPEEPDGRPDIELAFLADSFVGNQKVKMNLGLEDDIYKAVFAPLANADKWSILPLLLRPKSKGRIILKNGDPFVKPFIYHNYLTEPEDLATLVAGAKKVVELSKTPAFQKYGSRLHNASIPGCHWYTFGSDEYWACAARRLTFTMHHQVGTCKMGTARDEEAVVDRRLRVYGVKGLRVIDASIMPVIPAGHINAAVYMIAEKGSHMIKEDWRRVIIQNV